MNISAIFLRNNEAGAAGKGNGGHEGSQLLVLTVVIGNLDEVEPERHLDTAHQPNRVLGIGLVEPLTREPERVEREQKDDLAQRQSLKSRRGREKQ